MGGECEYSTLSTDNGATWAPLHTLEPSCALASHASSMIPSPPDGAYPKRIYAVYTYNINNVTHLPSGKKCSRTDDLGEFVMRYTEDDGRTWSSNRWIVPYRLTSIDKNNDWKGAVKMMETHVKANIIGN